MLVVLDTNLLLSALISPHGIPAKLYDAWLDHRFDLITCSIQLEEIRRASRYPKLRAILKPHLVGRMLNTLQRARIVDNAPRKHFADDPNDFYLLDLCDFTQANYLVTGDKRAGLLQLKRLRTTRILTAANLCEILLN